ILDLMTHWEIDRARSFLVGDQESDLAAGRAAGLAVHHFVADDLLAFMRQSNLL
ncbi:MAG: D-glycero-alpha-D-manno-heptose,7-bisphosphate 7-phosphatase, partial [Methylobacterium brachiatum]|nr:D-glycero-alpha-D-manno-heptose,7-bisphosphate 7-phosphatase [Methylobacterium brachiatum]